MANSFKPGDILEFDGLPCVVVGLSGDIIDDDEVPEEHIAVWFGDSNAKRKSEGGMGGIRTEIWTIPEEYFAKGKEPLVRH
ncbi:hypothetical protein [Hymenobacter luteus]